MSSAWIVCVSSLLEWGKSDAASPFLEGLHWNRNSQRASFSLAGRWQTSCHCKAGRHALGRMEEAYPFLGWPRRSASLSDLQSTGVFCSKCGQAAKSEFGISLWDPLQIVRINRHVFAADLSSHGCFYRDVVVMLRRNVLSRNASCSLHARFRENAQAGSKHEPGFSLYCPRGNRDLAVSAMHRERLLS